MLEFGLSGLGDHYQTEIVMVSEETQTFIGLEVEIIISFLKQYFNQIFFRFMSLLRSPKRVLLFHYHFSKFDLPI